MNNWEDIKGLKIAQENIERPKIDTLPETGPAMTRPIVNGRSPETSNIPINTIRTDHHRKEYTSQGESSPTDVGFGGTNTGPHFKDTKKAPTVRNADPGVNTGPSFK